MGVRLRLWNHLPNSPGCPLVLLLTASLLLAVSAASAERKGAPLKNSTIISMVKGGLSDSVIVAAIQSSETQFDVSEKGRADLKQAGVSQKIIHAMMAAEAHKQASTQSPSSGRGVARATPAGPLQQPYVVLLQEKAKQSITTERAQIVQADTKSKDLNSLAADPVVAQALQGTVAELTDHAASKARPTLRRALDEATGGLAGGLFKKRTPTVTYVWVLASGNSSTVLATNMPKFEIAYDAVSGVNAEEYAPLLVKLVPTKENFRLVGATKGKADAQQSATPDWEIYSSFVEEKVPASLNKSAPGRFELVPATPLLPGEYALVLRPVVRNRRFAGTDLSNSQGEGQLFNSVWTFSVRPSSGAQ